IPAFALVLWALGWSMVVMGAAIHLPRKVTAVLALAMIVGHNLLDSIPPSPIWHVLHVPGFAIEGKLFVAYPLIPWVAVMALGYAFAEVYRWEPMRRRRFLIVTGTVVAILFIVVRAINKYGDPSPWTGQRTPALTVASFFNARKYPPSLDFLTMTLGPILVA